MLKPFFKKYGWRYIPGVIFLCICTWLNTRTPLVLGEAIERVAAGAWGPFIREVGLMVLLAVLVFVTKDLWRFFLIVTSREMEVWLRDELYRHLQLLPPRFYNDHRSGDLMAYAISDVNAVRMMCGMVVAQVLNAVSSILFSIHSMATSIHPTLTLLALLPVPVAVVVVVYLGNQVQSRFRHVQELFAAFSGHVQENVNGMRVIKAFAQERAQHEDFERESDEMRAASMRLYRVSTLIGPGIQLIFALSYVIGLSYGGHLVLTGEISLGDYVAFNTYLTLILQPIIMLGRVVDRLQRGIASYKRLDALFRYPEIPAFERLTEGYDVQGEIRAAHLSFTYPDGSAPALKDVSFRLPKGGTLGVVGPTGSGKSTLLNLIVKLQTPERGMLFIDGADVRDIPAAAIREASGYVPQDGFLFKGSLGDNVAFFSGATEAEQLEALRIAGLASDLSRLDDGLATDVGERGNHLSGGQRQRAALARALVRHPNILLLDDTLSAVDAHTEGEILSALKGELAGRTAIIVAHRLSAVENADEILYMENGSIAERGTHAQLVALNGKYAEMLRMQKREEEKRHG